MANKKHNATFGDKQSRHFLHYVKGKCKKHGIKLVLRKVRYLKLEGGIRCSGYFDDVDGVIAVAAKSPIALEILVHEFGHLTQFLDNCKYWKNLGDSLEKMTDWLLGKEVEDYDQHINVARDLELDNEKRSVRIIKDFGLNIDINMYIKRANSYVYFYNWMKQTRRWSSPTNSPYKNQRIIEAMPSTFQKSYKTIPKKLMQIYKEENI